MRNFRLFQPHSYLQMDFFFCTIYLSVTLNITQRHSVVSVEALQSNKHQITSLLHRDF